MERLFDGVNTPRLPVVNWAGVVSLLAGIFSTWLFMYGLIPVMQGPIAVALGGWDLSWLAGGLTSAACYAILGPRVHKRFLLAESNHISVTQPAPAPTHEPAAQAPAK